MTTEIVQALPVIVSLIIMEGLLSVDNAMLISAMVDHLPEKQKKKALFYGMAGAYLFRGAALLCVSFLIANPWVKLAGASYLVYLMCKHLGLPEEGEEKAHQNSSESGFWATVVAVEIADLAFSIDNVIAAVALSDKLWVVIAGVFIGIAAMRFVAGLFVSLMQRYPFLKSIAYLLVGFVGVQLIGEELWHWEVSELEKFLSIVGIIAFGLIYDRFNWLKRLLSPAVIWLGQGMANVAELVDWAFAPVRGLVKILVRLCRRLTGRPEKTA